MATATEEQRTACSHGTASSVPREFSGQGSNFVNSG